MSLIAPPELSCRAAFSRKLSFPMSRAGRGTSLVTPDSNPESALSNSPALTPDTLPVSGSTKRKLVALVDPNWSVSPERNFSRSMRVPFR